MSNKEAFWEFAKGLTFGLGVMGVFVFFVTTLGGHSEKSPERFKVVDHYRYCDVVRYEPDGGARYSYFLDCNGSKDP